MELRGTASRHEQRPVRWFFAGLLVVNAGLDIVGAMLTQHQARSQLLDSLLPVSVILSGRTGVVLAGLALLLLAAGVARGKRVAWQLTCLVLVASIALDLVKDLDFEDAALAAWILVGLWWLRRNFAVAANPASVRRGFSILAAGLALAVAYAVGGSLLLGNQLSPGFGLRRSLAHLAESLVAGPVAYQALTQRADWFLGSIPIVCYALVLLALIQLLRPALAPRAAAAERERVRQLLETWGRNRISRLAVHGTASYFWPNSGGCVPFSLLGRTALVLGDPIGQPSALGEQIRDFVAYCDGQDWIPAFYQVDGSGPYRELGFTMVPIGSEGVIKTTSFTLAGRERHDLRYALRKCESAGITISFQSGPAAWAALGDQLRDLSGEWLEEHRGPELGFSLGTLATLQDPAITVGLAIATNGRLEAIVSWLPVRLRRAWTLDLMRRRPDSPYGTMEALLVRSIQEAASRGLEEISLGLAPRLVRTAGVEPATMKALKALYWGLDRFQRSRTLHHFKAKFGPCWEDRYLAVPSSAVLPEVLFALALAHLPTAFRLGVGRGRGRERR